MSPELIAACLIALLGSPVLVTWLSNRRTRRGLQAVQTEIQSGNGKPTGEYITAMSATLDRIEGRQLEQDRRTRRVEDSMDQLGDDFRQHTKLDEARQDEILRRLPPPPADRLLA